MQKPRKRDELWRRLRHQFRQGEERYGGLELRFDYVAESFIDECVEVRLFNQSRERRRFDPIEVEKGNDLIGVCKLLLKKKKKERTDTQLTSVCNV